MGIFTSFQLKSRDAETRRRAALKLGVPGRTSSIAALEPLLKDGEWPVREAAVTSLGAIGTEAAAPLLLQAVRDADEVHDQEGANAIRKAAVEALARTGAPAVPPLLEALRDRHARLREAAIEALGAIGGEESVSALAAALGDDRSNVRQAAAPALARAAGRGGVPALRAALVHKDPATRRSAASALGLVAAPEASAALRAAMNDRDRPVRQAAVQSLVALASPEAVDALCGALLEGDRDLRAAAAAALRSFEWSPADARQRVVHAVQHGRFADAAREGDAAVEPLLAALADPDPAARRGAAEALGACRADRAAEGVAALLNDQDAGVRDAAVAALSAIGPPAAAPLVRALDDRNNTTRAAAARAIAAIGEGPVASALAPGLLAGAAVKHGGLDLRVVDTREALDEARLSADLLTILASQAGARLPHDTLQMLASLDDVMLIEPGRVPDPDERVSCEALRGMAKKRLG